jgi:hypothetical protein
MTLNHNNYDLLNIVSNEYSKQLIHLNIDFDFIDCNNLSNALKVISSFIHLQRLELFIARDPKINIKPIDSLFTEIAINCLKITHLSVIFERKSTHQLICGNIFAVFELFHNLVSFNARLPERQQIEDSNTSTRDYVSKLNDLTKSAKIAQN